MDGVADRVQTVGKMVRSWRELRRFSQLEFGVEADVSQRHLSFIESGRAAPSREMVLHLAEYLDVTSRDRNVMLLAAGYSPIYGDRPLDDPTLSHAKAALELGLRAHEPYPALTVDRHWNIAGANRGLDALLNGVDAELLKAPSKRAAHQPAPARTGSKYREPWRMAAAPARPVTATISNLS